MVAVNVSVYAVVPSKAAFCPMKPNVERR